MLITQFGNLIKKMVCRIANICMYTTEPCANIAPLCVWHPMRQDCLCTTCACVPLVLESFLRNQTLTF